MERIRQELVDERAGIAKSEETHRQRELKKVGKQVQVEKLKKRAKGRKEMEERFKGLKRSMSSSITFTSAIAQNAVVALTEAMMIMRSMLP